MGNLLIAGLLTGCEKSNEDVSAPIRLATMSEVMQSQSAHSKAAVTRSGLAQTLNSSESMTLFFPSDDAFRQVGFINEESLAEGDATAIANILKYHVLKGEQKAAVLAAGQVATINGKNVTIDKSSGIKLTGAGNPNTTATVTATDIQVGNGIIHTINQLLLPDARNLSVIVQTNGAFDVLKAALIRASLTGVLNGTTAYTLFAPTDDAFISYLGIPTKIGEKDRPRTDIQNDALAKINSMSVESLTALLNYHLVDGNNLSNSMVSGGTLTALNGSKLTITINDKSKAISLTGTSNTSASNVVQADVTATNGAIHIIDQVLIP